MCVPSWEERSAIDAGAQVDPGKCLYAHPEQDLRHLWEWLPRKYQVEPGAPVLLPEMLPVTTWEQNVRTRMGADTWDRMRKHAYRAAGFRCKICGTDGPLEAHEGWVLENETCTQRLTSILAMCPLCHKAHHLGIARRLGMLSAVKRHLQEVNGWSAAQLDLEIAEAYEVWLQRCEWPWTVDLDWLQRSGYLFV